MHHRAERELIDIVSLLFREPPGPDFLAALMRIFKCAIVVHAVPANLARRDSREMFNAAAIIASREENRFAFFRTSAD